MKLNHFRKENASIKSCGPSTITTKVSNKPHKDTTISNIDRSPSLFIMPSEIKVMPITGKKLVKGSEMAINNAQNNIIKVGIFSPDP